MANDAIYKITIQNSSGTTDREIGAKAENVLVTDSDGQKTLPDKLTEMTTAINNNKVPGNATADASGLMSREDYSKLQGIETGANKFILGKATTSTLGGVKIGNGINVDSTGKIFLEVGAGLNIANNTLVNSGVQELTANQKDNPGVVSATINGSVTDITLYPLAENISKGVLAQGMMTNYFTQKEWTGTSANGMLRNIQYAEVDSASDPGNPSYKADAVKDLNGLLICVYEN